MTFKIIIVHNSNFLIRIGTASSHEKNLLRCVVPHRLGLSLRSYLSSCSKPQVSKKLSKDQIEAVFAKFDGNGDGKLSKEEFQQLMAAKK